MPATDTGRSAMPEPTQVLRVGLACVSEALFDVVPSRSEIGDVPTADDFALDDEGESFSEPFDDLEDVRG